MEKNEFLGFSYKKIVFGLILFGFILRIFAAMNLGVFADDMHFAPGAINFLESGKMVYWDQSTGLWFAFTDVMYNLFGVSQLTSRLASLIFGTLLIPLIFLWTRELTKNDFAAIFATLLVTISPFFVKSMMAEMDTMAMFFVLLSLVILQQTLKEKSISLAWFSLSAITLGLGIMTKVYPILFLPGIVIWIYLSGRSQDISKKDIFKRILLFVIIIGLLAIPTLVHNLILYQEKNILDHQFTRVFDLGRGVQEYQWLAGGGEKASVFEAIFPHQNSSGELNSPGLWVVFKLVFFADPLIIFLAIGGLYFLRNEKSVFIFIGLLIILPLLYLSSTMLLTKHYLFVSIFLVPFSGYACMRLTEKISQEHLKYLLVGLIIFSLLLLGWKTPGLSSPLYSESSIGQVIDFKKANIPENAIVVADNRIYRGNTVWMLYGTSYIEVSGFQELLSLAKETNQTRVQDVFFIECVSDDCGWGTIANQKELNASMENFFQVVKNQAKLSATIQSPSSKWSYPFFGQKSIEYRIFKAQVPLPIASQQAIKQTHIWWLYPVGYDETINQIFDTYSPYTLTQVFLNSLAKVMWYLLLLGVFTSPIILYTLMRKNHFFSS